MLTYININHKNVCESAGEIISLLTRGNNIAFNVPTLDAV